MITFCDKRSVWRYLVMLIYMLTNQMPAVNRRNDVLPN